MKCVDDVKQFHKKMGFLYEGPPRSEYSDRDRRIEHLLEEVYEYAGAKDLAQQLDALLDLIYVAAGAIIEHGLADVADEAWDRVHAANMRKQGTSQSEGKGGVVKPPGWQPPSLTSLVQQRDTRPCSAAGCPVILCVACGGAVFGQGVGLDYHTLLCTCYNEKEQP
jgi:predicted HAD superfamily Cof-like phosphohydrolase